MVSFPWWDRSIEQKSWNSRNFAPCWMVSSTGWLSHTVYFVVRHSFAGNAGTRLEPVVPWNNKQYWSIRCCEQTWCIHTLHSLSTDWTPTKGFDNVSMITRRVYLTLPYRIVSHRSWMTKYFILTAKNGWKMIKRDSTPFSPRTLPRPKVNLLPTSAGLHLESYEDRGKEEDKRITDMFLLVLS